MRNGSIDILAIGHAPIIAINRRFYAALRGQGWDIELAIPEALPWKGAPLLQPAASDDPPLHSLPVRGSHLRFWAFEGLLDLLDRRNPKIVLVENDPNSRMAWEVGAWAHRHNAVAVCITNENDLPPTLPALLQGQLKIALRSMLSRLASLITRRRIDHVFAICKDGVAIAESLGFRERTTLIPLGFDAKLFKPYPQHRRAQIRQQLKLTKPVIAYFGRVTRIKGVHLLIEALGRMRDLEWQLLLDQPDESLDDYEQRVADLLVSQGINDRTVAFRANHEQMPDFMNVADVVAAPSIWKEQYGRVIPEAMACGCAVVVSDIGAMPELLGECGLKVPAGDVAALEHALRRLLVDVNERNGFGRAAALRARAHLSIETQVAVADATLRRLSQAPFARVGAHNGDYQRRTEAT